MHSGLPNCWVSKIPAIPVEYQFIVTEPDPALVAFREAGNIEHPVLRDGRRKMVRPVEERGRLDP